MKKSDIIFSINVSREGKGCNINIEANGTSKAEIAQILVSVIDDMDLNHALSVVLANKFQDLILKKNNMATKKPAAKKKAAPKKK